MEEQPLEQMGNEAPTIGEGQEPAEQTEQQAIPESEAQAEQEVKTFTQEDVNRIIKERLERHGKSIYSKYGVEDEKGFDDIFARSEAYSEMKERYESMQSENESLRNELATYRENALLNQYGISLERYDDVKTWFKGKGEKITEGMLKEALESHPEWKVEEKKTTIVPVGSTREEKPNDSDAIAKKIFGLDHFVG